MSGSLNADDSIRGVVWLFGVKNNLDGDLDGDIVLK